MTENEKQNLSFDVLPRTVAELHVKVDRLTEMLERLISSADTKPLPKIMTVEDVAAMLCKSVSTIYAMTSSHRIPYRKQGNKLYFLRPEINAWLFASIVPKDVSKRKRKPQENGNADGILPVPESVAVAAPDRNGADEVANRTENNVAASENEQENTAYSIERRIHSKSGAPLFAVLFSNEIEITGERKFVQTARDYHGYWSDFGKGGYIFSTQPDAEGFAETIRGKG